MNYRSICSMCQHFNGTSGDPAEDATCVAFPLGIPNEILQFGFDHRQPFEGDGGIMFVPDGPVDTERIERIVAPMPELE